MPRLIGMLGLVEPHLLLGLLPQGRNAAVPSRPRGSGSPARLLCVGGAHIELHPRLFGMALTRMPLEKQRPHRPT